MRDSFEGLGVLGWYGLGGVTGRVRGFRSGWRTKGVEAWSGTGQIL